MSLGCYVGDVYCGCVMYADDLISVSVSVTLLQRMTDTVATGTGRVAEMVDPHTPNSV